MTSAGKRKPAKAEQDCDRLRKQEDNFTGPACPNSLTIAQRNSTGVLNRDHYTCAYCGRTATTVDHAAELAGWQEHLGEHGRCVRAVQSAEG